MAKKKKPSERKPSSSASSDSGSEDEELAARKAMAKGKKSSERKPLPEHISDSDSDEIPLAAVSRKKDPRGKHCDPQVVNRASKHLKHLERIARVSGVMPCGRGITLMYSGCKNTNQRIRKIKQVLEEAGMNGKSSCEGQ